MQYFVAVQFNFTIGTAIMLKNNPNSYNGNTNSLSFYFIVDDLRCNKYKGIIYKRCKDKLKLILNGLIKIAIIHISK